jgi:hypothetical protein
MPLAFLDTGSSSTISDRIKDFLRLHYSKRAIVIDVAGGGTLKTHFYGTTCTYVKGHSDTWLLLVQDDVLYVPQAGEGLLSLCKITAVRYKCTLHERVLNLLYADTKRMDQVALIVTAVNDVFPIMVKSMKHSEADARQVNEVLTAHSGTPTPSCNLAFAAFPRVVGANQVGEANLVKGEGEGYINHCKLGHRAGAAARMDLADIPPGNCPTCMATGMPNLKEPDEGNRRAEHFLQYVIVDAQGPFPANVRGNRYWVAVADVHTKLKISFPALTLKAAIKFLDHVLKRERNAQTSRRKLCSRAQTRRASSICRPTTLTPCCFRLARCWTVTCPLSKEWPAPISPSVS